MSSRGDFLGSCLKRGQPSIIRAGDRVLVLTAEGSPMDDPPLLRGITFFLAAHLKHA